MGTSLQVIILFVCLVLLSSVAEAGLQQISEANSPQIKAILQSQDPDPVEPGEIITVKFKIENEGQQSGNDIIVELRPKFPFTLYGDTATRNLGKLKAVSTGADAIVIQYRLKVDEGAVEKDTELELRIKDGDGYISYTNNDFLISVQTNDAILDITSITSEPEQIAPGETAEVSVMVKNLADSLLRDIKFNLNFNGIGLAPYQSSSQRRIAQLPSNYQNTLKFKIIADPEAEPGLYKVPVNITYTDENGKNYYISDLLALTVGDAPKVRAYLKKSTVLQANKAGVVTLEIANAGTTNVKFLELKILPSDDYELISTSDYIYIGDVDSDDTESEELDIFIKRGVKTLHFPIQLKYTDANNKALQQAFDLELNLYSSSKLRKYGLAEGSKLGLYGLILIIIGVGYLIYRRRSKK
jgi:hypothetical protein